MPQQEKPDYYVIATGETYSVRQFLELAFDYLNLKWEDFVEFDPLYLRSREVELLIGDPLKANKQLNWEPTIDFSILVSIMVETDLASLGLPPHNYDMGWLYKAERAFVRQTSGSMVV